MKLQLSQLKIGTVSFVLGVAFAKLVQWLRTFDAERPTIRVRHGSILVEIDDGEFTPTTGIDLGGASTKWRAEGKGDQTFTVRASGHAPLEGTTVTLHFRDRRDAERNLVISNDNGVAQMDFPAAARRFARKRKKKELRVDDKGLKLEAYSVGSTRKTLTCFEPVVEID